MGRRKKLINRSGIPEHAIEAIARVLLPDILAYYESEEGQRAFAAWKKQQDAKIKRLESEYSTAAGTSVTCPPLILVKCFSRSSRL